MSEGFEREIWSKRVRKRDNFPARVRRLVAERAGYLCSNPDCRHPTCGPHSDPEKSIITGEAAHICAAAKMGPRYDPNQTPEERKAITNAIWLCGNCNKKVDTDWAAWPAERLRSMKADHERWVQAEAMIPALPEVSLSTLANLRLDEELQQITPEIQATLREQELLIRNPNRVERHSFVLDMALPEFFTKVGKTVFPPGSEAAFKTVQPDMVGFVSGHLSITAGRPVPTTQCRLEIEKLPALSECRQAFYTIAPDDTMPTMPYSPGPTGIEFFGNPEDMETTKVCHFYLQGTYKFLLRGEFIEGQFFVPLFFKVSERAISSLPVQVTTDPWHPWSYTMRAGIVMQSGRVKAE
jgi:hypothetical protein